MDIQKYDKFIFKKHLVPEILIYIIAIVISVIFLTRKNDIKDYNYFEFTLLLLFFYYFFRVAVLLLTKEKIKIEYSTIYYKKSFAFFNLVEMNFTNFNKITYKEIDEGLNFEMIYFPYLKLWVKKYYCVEITYPDNDKIYIKQIMKGYKNENLQIFINNINSIL